MLACIVDEVVRASEVGNELVTILRKLIRPLRRFGGGGHRRHLLVFGHHTRSRL